MRSRCFQWLALLTVVAFLGAAATPAQEAADLDALRRERAKLEEALRKMEREFDEVVLKLRAEWDLKRQKLEKEHRASFGKRHAEVARKLKDLAEREKSIQRKAEAKEKGFHAKLEVKGRLEQRISGEPTLFLDIDQKIWWEVIVGDVHYELDFKKNAAFLKLAASNNNKTILVTGIAATNHRLEVQALEVVKD
jgi:hypothetical protein